MPGGKGILIIIEGIDGAGKSTQARMLYDDLQRRGIDTVLSREPTDSKYGRKIRELAEKGRETAVPEEEYRLFMKDRRIHVDTLIQPAIENGKVVILDRYYFSTIAYQGALGLDPVKIRSDNEAFCPKPDLVLLIDIPVTAGIDRIRKYRRETPNLFEKESYLDKVARCLAALDDEFIVRIDGSGSLGDVHDRIRAYVEPLIRPLVKQGG
ncbi:MAG: dTMP kinase [Deltaproteobacteria bacterium]|nr:MAG: dTMP kinase [Deltaproteobacteria bacterium]